MILRNIQKMIQVVAVILHHLLAIQKAMTFLSLDKKIKRLKMLEMRKYFIYFLN